MYRFKYRAVNVNGESLWSQPTSIAFAPKPSTPASPSRSSTGNSPTSIGVQWTAITTDTLPVLQYVLYVNDGTSSDNTLIYRGSSTSYVMTNTNPGSTYTFYVMAENYNGYSSLSTGTSLISCIEPYSVYPPTLIESTSTTLRLGWQSPGNDGGCEVTSFGLLRDDGAGGSIITSVDSGTISGNPNLFEHTVTLSSLKGKEVRFKLQVTNQIGTTTSTAFLTALVAGLPAQPSAVTANTDETTGSQISFTIPEISDEGGSYIATYHVEMDDGEGGDFVTISGYPQESLKTDFLITQGIQISNTYAVRYRVRNKIGWSDYSDVTYILAAETPSAPTKPVYVSSTSTELTLEFGTSLSNGGSEISTYSAQIDKDDGSGYTDLLTYTASTTSQALTIDGNDPTQLQPGTLYRFRSKATNSAGFTSYSHELRIAAAQLPSQPSSAPQWQESLSNITSIGVSWDAVAATEISTTGYKLFRDGGNDGNYTLVYNGAHRPGQRAYVSHNLKTGTYYRFKYTALNFNGESPESDVAIIPACLPPSGLASPTFVSGTSTTIKLEWTTPTTMNGCPLKGFKLYQGTTSDSVLTTEVDTSLNTNPSARSYTITFASGNEGTVYRFQLEAINGAGSVKSGIAQVTLAGVPETPTTGPQSVATLTNSTHITVQILQTVPNLNGGTLKKVHVQMDQGGDGDYQDIIGPEESCIDTIFTISEGIVASNTYQFRYRIMNENGWSEYSPVTKIAAASSPSSPARPTLVSATVSQLALSFSRPSYTGGADITSYELYINECDRQSEPGTKVTGYTDNAMAYTVTLAEIATLSGGEICAFKFRAINAEGYYADSTIISAAFANTATKPNVPTKVDSESSQTSITVMWDEVTSTQTPGGTIRGYRLYMRKANGGEKTIVYQKTNLKSIRKFTATGLEAGQEYIFSVQAYQFNGWTEESDSTTIKACGAPSLLYPPTLVSASSTQFELQWEPPLSCGGCSIIEYALFMDDGNGGTLSEIDSSSIRGFPTKSSHTVTSPTIPASSEGNTFMFKLLVRAEGGDIESETIGYTLASVPDAPTSVPASDSTVSNNTVIKVDVATVTATGGSPITSYSIEIDDGDNGSFTALYGTLTNSLSTTYTLYEMIEGNTYRFRYRVKNSVGWSAYSPVGYITAMSTPEAPLAPVFVSATESTISLALNFVTENNGGLITTHELYRDQGNSGTSFIKVTSYDGESSTLDLTTTIDNTLVAGTIYQFKFRGVNEAGNGAFSDPISVALARLPEQISTITHVTSKSTQTRIAISWTPNTDRDSPGGNVLKFKIYMAEGSGGVFSLVHTTSSASITSYTATGLTPGNLYRFKVSAVNYNGEGTVSNIKSIYACEAPQGLYAPSYVSATETTMVVSWKAPTFNGA